MWWSDLSFVCCIDIDKTHGIVNFLAVAISPNYFTELLTYFPFKFCPKKL